MRGGLLDESETDMSNNNSNNSNNNTSTGALDELVRRYGVALTPREALLELTGVRDTSARVGTRGAPCRDAATLRKLGVVPVLVLGRWVVPAAEVAAWARGERTPMRVDRRRREHRAPAPRAAQGGAA
jgi:hypothetical protein